MMAFGVTDKELVKYLLLHPLNLQQTHDNKLHLNSLSLRLNSMEGKQLSPEEFVIILEVQPLPLMQLRRRESG